MAAVITFRSTSLQLYTNAIEEIRRCKPRLFCDKKGGSLMFSKRYCC